MLTDRYSSIVDDIISGYQERFSYDLEKCPEMIKTSHKLEKLRDNLTKLIPEQEKADAHGLLNDLSDIAGEPAYHADQFGFKQGFKAALRLIKELDRWAA